MTPPAGMSGHHETARQQSRAAWGAVASGWYAQREELWKASHPVSEWMIRRLDPKPGDTVLELAAGLADTGLMAARLVGESGRVIVTDFTPEMVAAARRRAEELDVRNAEFRVLDAERMDLETDSVDGVLCRWAYMLMIDPPAAFAQTRRVLRPGGRLAFSVWAARERNPALSLVGRVLESKGHIPPPDPEAPQRLRHGRSGAHPRACGGGRLRRTRDRRAHLSLAFRREGCLLALCHRDVVVRLARPAGPFSRSAERGSGAGARIGSAVPIWRGIRLSGRMPQRRDVLILSRLNRFVYRRPLVAGFTLSRHHSPRRGLPAQPNWTGR
jgi:SAM-dependent methyltransferase